MGYGKESRVRDILADPAARSVAAKYIPAVTCSPVLEHMGFLPFSAVLHAESAAPADPAGLEAMWYELGLLEGTPQARAEAPYIEPAPDYEPASVGRGSARVRPVSPSEQWGVTELAIEGPSHGNPFVDVELSAEFTDGNGDGPSAGGFYDGDGMYRIRFQAPRAGMWTYVTTSSARSLDGLRGTFEVRPPGPGNHGPVGVADRFHFAYRDGTRFVPIGTTAYAWTHQPEALQERTLAVLAGAPFRKLRMCVFPKSYLFNTDDPASYPFGGTARGTGTSLVSTRSSSGFLSCASASSPGWGSRPTSSCSTPTTGGASLRCPKRPTTGTFSISSGAWALIARVWWSLANEYDLLSWKTGKDWERLAEVIGKNDHVGHLTSIHNCFGFYDHTRPWITHCSIQRTDVYRTAENTGEWRDAYAKPVVIDECGYEGDIDQGWGNLSGTELVRRCWEGAVRGGYVGHGETYLNAREELWWSKGGDLTGDSPQRIGFLLDIIDAAPAGVLEPLPSDWDVRWGGADDYRIAYFGFGRPRYRDITAAPGARWHVDVIDTWNMTIARQPGTFEGCFRIGLPGRQFMALRLVRAG